MDESQEKSLILRDQLAVHRTHMANERTLMAYLRTALMIFASGVTLLKIYDSSPFLKALGTLLLPFAVGIVVFSIIRFVHMKCLVDTQCSKAE